MMRDVLQSVEGISLYPIISMIIFVLFFAILIIWMIKVDKNYIKKMSNLPLEKEDENGIINTGELNEK
ncbi:MAG: cbb3-type cytochrome c oxidase subunit 3 [Ignavibacterium sp.]|nr:cbb3-type cytochrome c oxidase subunit 3 [Ignavibacterium sp.]